MFDFVAFRKWFYALTGLLMLGSVIALVLTPHLPWGLEFSSGSALDIEFKDPPPGTGPADLRAKLEAAGVKGAVVQQTGDKAFFIRTSRVEDKLDDILAQQFPTAKAENLQSSSDLASVVSFKDPVPGDALKSQFDPTTQDLVVNKTGDLQFFISASGVADDQLQKALDAYQKLYGPVQPTSFKDPGDMAITLDFGPAVPEASFKTELDKAVPGLQETALGTNNFLLVGPDVPADKKGDLVPTLEKTFGRAKVTSYNEAGDLALTLNFDKPLAINDVRNELINKSYFTIISVPNGDKSVVLLAKGLAADKKDQVVKDLRNKFGAVQPVPFDFQAGIAESVDFGATVTADAVQRAVAALQPTAVVSALSGNTYFIGGKGVTEQQQNDLVSGVEQGLGLTQRAPFDYSKGTAMQVKFTDPVQLGDVTGNLAIFPITDAIQGRATVRPVSPNNFFLFGSSILPDAQSSVLADIKGKVGAFDKSGLDKPDDIRVALDFGPTVNTTDLRSEAAKAQPGASVDALEQQTFFLGALNAPPDKRDALLSGLESRFGLAKRTAFQDAGDWALMLTFQDNVTIGAVRSEVNAQNTKGTVVGSLGGKSFFVGGKGITVEQQTAILDALQKRFNNFDRAPFDYNNGVAMTLDFGLPVTATAFQAQVKNLGFPTVRVAPIGDTKFFLGGSGLSAEKQSTLISGLETQFGLSRRDSFNAPENMAIIIHLTDPDQVAAGVQEKLIVQKLGPNRFFLGGAGISGDRQQETVSALEAGLGAVQRTPYDFTTNVAMVIAFPSPVTEDSIKSALQPFGYTNMQIEKRGESTYFIRSDRPSIDQKNKLVNTLQEAFGPADPTKTEFSFVDPEIARRSIVNTFIAVAVSCVGIMLYVWWAFRKAPKPFRYGVAVVTGLIHDVVIVLGAFGIMAKFREVSFDSLMIIGILAVIGFSVNNTIVVLDRLRENLAKSPGRGLDNSANLGLNETLARNLNTTVTTALAILAVLLFGGNTIFNFMLVLLIGTLAGLYSSLFIAAPLLVSWDRGELPRLRVPFLKHRTPAPAAKQGA